MKNVEVTTFNVGQGLFNLVTGTKDNGMPYCGVFDCGNFNSENQGECIDKALEIINNIPNFKNFDNVVISHQDVDHWRMFLVLMARLNGITVNGKWYKVDNISGAFLHKKNISREIHKMANQYYSEVFYILKDEPATLYGYSTVSNKNNITSLCINIVVDNINIDFNVNHKTCDSPDYVVRIFLDSKPCALYQISEIPSVYEILDAIEPFVVEFTASKIRTLLENTQNYFEFNFQKLDDIFNNAYIIQHGIAVLGLGGESCEAQYKLFCRQCWGFSSSCFTDSFLHILENKYTIKKIKFEKDILNKNGQISFILNSAVYKNATSEIVLFDTITPKAILFPGDATVHTFKHLNRLLPRTTQIQLFLAPHHGSFDTNFAFKINGNSISLANKQPLDKLLKTFLPCNIYISAFHTKYGHPTKSFVETCLKHCPSTIKEKHDIIYCPDEKFGTITEVKTTRNLFTTECGGDLTFTYPPPLAVVSAKSPDIPVQLPDNNLFIPYGGFDL